jgi:hypothetical protein
MRHQAYVCSEGFQQIDGSISLRMNFFFSFAVEPFFTTDTHLGHFVVFSSRYKKIIKNPVAVVPRLETGICTPPARIYPTNRCIQMAMMPSERNELKHSGNLSQRPAKRRNFF